MEGYFYPHFLNEETEVLRGEVIGSMSHSQEVIMMWEMYFIPERERGPGEPQRRDGVGEGWEVQRARKRGVKPKGGQRKARPQGQAMPPVLGQ